MKTGIPAPFHDAKAPAGVYIDCYRQAAAKGNAAAAKSQECQRKK